MIQQAIETFTAPTMSQALAKVREALGDDAVILHTRQVPSKGLLGRSTPAVEITASLGTAPAVDATRELAPPAFSATNDISSAPSLDEQVRRLQKLVDRLSRVPSGSSPATEAEPPGALEEYLRSLEFSESLIRECLDVAAHECPGVDDPQHLRLMESLVDYLAARLRARPLWDTDTKGKAIALVGPTGVGKTTTMVKWATQLREDRGGSVALASVDGYRIGAGEEIRRYGEILGVPWLLARTPTELKRFIDRQSEERTVLVDTPGRSPLETDEIGELVHYLGRDLRTVLVLSAHVRESALRACLDAFGKLHYERLILTKLDETPGTGAIATIAAISPVAIGGVCFGQSIRQDWQEVTSTQLARWALGEAARQPSDPVLVHA